jgi:hypothetical protein
MKIKCLLFVPIVLLGVNLFGQTSFWIAEGDPAYWEDPENWSSDTIPLAPDKTVFKNPVGADCNIISNHAIVKQLVLGDNSAYGGVLTIKEGAVLTTHDESSWSAVGYNNGAQMRIERGGTLNSAHRFYVGIVAPVEGADSPVLEVAGTLNAPKFFVNSPGEETWSCEVFVTPGGAINTDVFDIGSGGLLDVSGGQVVIAHDVSDHLAGLIDSGLLTAEGGTEAPLIKVVITGVGVEADTTTWIMSSTSPPPPPDVPVNELLYCLNETASQLSATGENLKWYTEGSGSFSTEAPIPSTGLEGVTTYYVTQTSNGAESDSAVITVTVQDYVELSLSEQLVSSGQNITLSASSNYSGEGEETFTWEGSTFSGTGETVEYYSDTPDVLKVTFGSSTGCIAIDSFLVLAPPEASGVPTDSKQIYIDENDEIIKLVWDQTIRAYPGIADMNDELWSFDPGVGFTNCYFYVEDGVVFMVGTEGGETNTTSIRSVTGRGELLAERTFETALQSDILIYYMEEGKPGLVRVEENLYAYHYGSELYLLDSLLTIKEQHVFSNKSVCSLDYIDSKILALIAGDDGSGYSANYELVELNTSLEVQGTHALSVESEDYRLRMLQMKISSTGDICIIEDLRAYASGETKGIIYMLDGLYSEKWRWEIDKHENPWHSSLEVADNGNVIAYFPGKGTFSFTGTGDINYFYANSSLNIDYLVDGGQAFTLCIEYVTYKISKQDGTFLSWRAKSDISYVEDYNPERVLCIPDPEKGIMLELTNVPDYGARDFTWSNGLEGRQVVITEPGTYYVDYVWGENNTGYSDTVNIEDLVNVVPKPDVDISFSGPLTICEGSALTAEINVINDNGLAYTYSHYPTMTDFDGTIDISSEGGNAIRVMDAYGCAADSAFEITIKKPYPDDICMVTADPVTGKNMIIWDKTANKGTLNYSVLRGFGYDPVGSEPFNGANYIIDMEENPAIQAFRYFLETTDTCGNSEIAAISHKTIHLTANVGTSGEVNLIWQPYEGVQAYQYNFYRSIDSVNFTKIGGMEYDPSISQYSDYNPPTGKIYYQIGIEGPFNCQPQDAKKSVLAGSEILSNVKSMDYSVGMDEAKLLAGKVRVYPNPASDQLFIEFQPLGGIDYGLTIYNTLGSAVYQQRVTESRMQLDVSGLCHGGLYMMQLTDPSGRVVYSDKLVIR